MKRYAHISDGKVFEIIEGFERREEDRPAAPEALPEPPEGQEVTLTAEQWKAREDQQAAHDAFVAGEVPIEERFTPEFVAALVLLPSDSPVQVGWRYDGEAFAEPEPIQQPSTEDDEAAKVQRIAQALAKLPKEQLDAIFQATQGA